MPPSSWVFRILYIERCINVTPFPSSAVPPRKVWRDSDSQTQEITTKGQALRISQVMVSSCWQALPKALVAFPNLERFVLCLESMSNILPQLTRLSATVSFMGMFSCTSLTNINEVKILF